MVKKNNSTFRSPSVSGSTVMIFMAYSFLLELHLLSFRSELRSCGERPHRDVTQQVSWVGPGRQGP